MTTGGGHWSCRSLARHDLAGFYIPGILENPSHLALWQCGSGNQFLDLDWQLFSEKGNQIKRSTVHIRLTFVVAVTSKVKLFAGNLISSLGRKLGETKRVAETSRNGRWHSSAMK